MRPAKRILLVDGDETRLGMRAYLIEVRTKSIVTRCRSAAELLEKIQPEIYDVLVVVVGTRSEVDGRELIERAWKLDPGIRVLAIGDAGIGEHVSLRDEASPTELLETLAILLGRKRGPKPVRLSPPREDAA